MKTIVIIKTIIGKGVYSSLMPEIISPKEMYLESIQNKIRETLLPKAKAPEFNGIIENESPLEQQKLMTAFNKLYKAWEVGANDKEAAAAAGIMPWVYKEWLEESYPQLADIRDVLRAGPTLKAKENVIDKLRKGDADFSLKYLEKVSPAEFGGKPQTQINIQNNINDRLARLDEVLLSYGGDTDE